MIIDESLVIKAPIEKVWQTFIDLSCWADWNTVLTNVTGGDNITEGRAFRCSIRPFVFPVYFEPRIQNMKPFQSVTWITRKYGITARHEFLFEKETEGVRIRSREVFSGFIIFVAGWMLLTKLRELTVVFLKDLKHESEVR